MMGKRRQQREMGHKAHMGDFNTSSRQHMSTGSRDKKQYNSITFKILTEPGRGNAY